MKMHVLVVSLLAVTSSSTAAQAPSKSGESTQDETIKVLRRTLEQQQANPDKIIRTPSAAEPEVPPGFSPSPAELERRYLAGKISAKQYQKGIEQWHKEAPKRAAALAEKERAEAEAERKRLLKKLREQQEAEKQQVASQQLLRRAASPRDTRVKKRIPPKPVIKPAGPTPEQQRVAEVQAKIEAMIQQRAAREKAALTKQTEAPDAQPAGPQTKRQRLDALLKQMITGQISETDYAEKRAKVIAEPE